MAQYTGGSPNTTGIWYDVTWDKTYYAPGTGCQGSAGYEVAYDETLDYNSSLLFSGGIDPANLPMTFVNGSCQSIPPHERILVNTVFNVMGEAGLQAAYVDKHPSYTILRGPSNIGMTVSYFPEIASIANTLNATIAYDELHVQAWLDFIDGQVPVNATGMFSPAEMPAFMGGNFQSVSVAQKTYGYTANLSFTPQLLSAFDFVDSSIGQIVSKLSNKGMLDKTLIIVASKHGQSPINSTLLDEIDPDLLMNGTGVPTDPITADDIGLIWLNHTSDIPMAVANLQAQSVPLGIQEVIYGQSLLAEFGNSNNSPRTPDIIVRSNVGVIYTTNKKKIAEHGGLSDDDRHVACFVSNPSLKKTVVSDRVSTRQVAPTILQALGLNPQNLQAVVQQGTQSLNGLFNNGWSDWS